MQSPSASLVSSRVWYWTVLFMASSILSIGSIAVDRENGDMVDENESPKGGLGIISLRRRMRNETGIEGGRVSFYCDITGDPMPNFKWYKGTKQIESNIPKKLKMKQALWGSLLKVENLSAVDTGWYTCLAVNPKGQVNTTAYLNIKPAPKLPPPRETVPKKLDSDQLIGEGFCQAFKSSVCGKYLGGQQLFVTHVLTQSQREQEISALIASASSNSLISTDGICLHAIMEAVCFFNFPLCVPVPSSERRVENVRIEGQEKGLARRLCREDCETLKSSQCGADYRRLELDINDLTAHLMVDCSSLPSQSDETSFTTCIELSSRTILGGRFSKQKDSQIKPVEDKSCYNGTGETYSGKVNVSRSGINCLSWNMMAGFAFQEEHNYCRSPEPEAWSMHGPWCFTNSEGDRERCDIPRCPGSVPPTVSTDLLPIYISMSILAVLSLCLLLICCFCRRSTATFSSPSSHHRYSGIKKTLGGPPSSNGTTGHHHQTSSSSIQSLHPYLQHNNNGFHASSTLHHKFSAYALPQTLGLNGTAAMTLNSAPTMIRLPNDVADVSLANIRMYEEIGKSYFGPVYRGELLGHTSPGSVNPVLIKTLLPPSLPSSQLQADFLQDLHLLAQLRHPNVSALLATSLSAPTSPWYSVMEGWCGYTSHHLHDYLIYHSPHCNPAVMETSGVFSCNELYDTSTVLHHRGGPMTFADQLKVASQIAAGLEYLDSRSYVHRDLAARNILVGPGLTCKIAAWGQFFVFRDSFEMDYCSLSDVTCNATNVTMTTSAGGTTNAGSGSSMKRLPIRWMPPESLLYGTFSVESDIWSFGVVLWEIWSFGLQPFYGLTNTEVVHSITNRQLLLQPDACPSNIYALMVECWNELPQHRPRCRDIHNRLRGWHQQHAISSDYELPQTSPSCAPHCQKPRSAISGQTCSSSGQDISSLSSLQHNPRSPFPHYSPGNTHQPMTSYHQPLTSPCPDEDLSTSSYSPPASPFSAASSSRRSSSRTVIPFTESGPTINSRHPSSSMAFVHDQDTHIV